MNVIREVKSGRVGDRYYEVKHPSGLRISVYPKEQNNSTYAVFGTRYGSIDTTFKTSDEKMCIRDRQYLPRRALLRSPCASTAAL